MNVTVDETATSAIGASLALVSTIAIICNILFLITIATVRRTVPETLLLILSLLDLMFCMLVMPLSTVAYLLDWNVADTPSACDFQGTLSFATKFSSTFVVSLISLERYFCFKPSRTFLHKSWNGRMIVVCGACVMACMLLGAVPLIAGTRMKHFENSMSYCHFDITPDDSVSTTFSIMVLISAYIMLQISMFCLVSVLCNWEAYATLHHRSSSGTNPDETQHGGIVHARGNTNSTRDLNQRLGLTRMLLTVSFLHWCCHLPFIVLMAVTQIGGSVSQTADFIAVYILAVQPALNPLVIFALYPPYYHNLKGKFSLKTNDVPVFNHSSDESRYRDVSQQDSSYRTRNVHDTIQTRTSDAVRESISHDHNAPSYSRDDVLNSIRLDDLRAESSDKKLIGQHNNHIGMYNNAYYDSESFTCSTCSGSDVSDDDGTEGFDTDFSEYSYTTDEGHQRILYLNRRSRKVLLPRRRSKASHKIYQRSIRECGYGKYLSQRDDAATDCISFPRGNGRNERETRPQLSLNQGDREQAQQEVVKKTPNGVSKTDNSSVTCDKMITEQTILSDDVNEEEVHEETRSRQIIGRRELRRLGIKNGRLAETFRRDSIPQETSLYQTSRRQNICLVCRGPYARHVPHSKHNVHKIHDAIADEPPRNANRIRSKDQRFMNVLFQKALYEHSRGTESQLHEKDHQDGSDGSEALAESQQNPRLAGSAKQSRRAREDIHYRQYIRHIASLKRRPVMTNEKHTPDNSQQNGTQNSVPLNRARKKPNFTDAMTNLRNGDQKILEENSEEAYKASTVSDVASEYDHRTTEFAIIGLNESDVNISTGRPTTVDHNETNAGGIDDRIHCSKIDCSMQNDQNELYKTETKADVVNTQFGFEQVDCTVDRDMDAAGVDSNSNGITVGSTPVFTIEKVNENRNNHGDVTTERLSNQRKVIQYPMHVPKIEVTDLSSCNDREEPPEQSLGHLLCQLMDAKMKLSPNQQFE